MVPLAARFTVSPAIAATRHATLRPTAPSEPSPLALLLAALAAIALALIALRLWRRHAILRRARRLTAQHLPALARRRLQLVRPDAYGKPQFGKWEKEVDYFVDTHIADGLRPAALAALVRCRVDVLAHIHARVEDAVANQAGCDGMTGAEFELYCAGLLRHAGWQAALSPAGPDQGADIVAEKNGLRIVLQCKLYSRPVGNRAVQEASAARAHAGARLAAVVSNAAYTRAAQELAASNTVLLLHYSELAGLDALVNTPAA
jgi:restriction system protein